MGNAAIFHGLFSQRYLVKGTCQVCDDDMRPLGDATQGGVNVRQQGRLGFTVPAYVSKGSDKTRTAVRLLYKERRVQVFYSDRRDQAALGGQDSLGVLPAYHEHIGGGGLSAVGARRGPC